MDNTSIQVFNNERFGRLRATMKDGEPWFVAADVCDALGLGNASRALMRLDDDEKGLTSSNTLGGEQLLLSVNESGIYRLVLSSRKKEAKPFQRWVTHDVLPSIRRDGGYLVARDETPEQTMARAILLAQSTMERQRAQIDELAPKAFFADAVASSDTLILVRDLAHVLAQNGLGIGQNRLFALLRKDGYLEQHRNEATQKSIELGVMRMTSGVYMGADGNSHTKRTAKVTGKGQQYFVARYCGKGVA